VTTRVPDRRDVHFCLALSWLYPVWGRGGVQVMSDLVRTLGPLPKHWHGRFKYYDEQGDNMWYDQSRVPVEYDILKSRVARRRPAASQEEQGLVVSVFEKVFCYEPTDRWTAAQLLECPDFIALVGRYISIL
jgi:hypothetical protein